MDRLARFLCDPVKVIKAVLTLALSVLVLVYVYFQAVGTGSGDIETETSFLVTLTDYIDADAYIFRDETVIDSIGGGTVVTVVANGERVSKGSLVANVYADSQNAVLQDEINTINRRIEILEDSSAKGGFVISDLDKIDKDISDILANVYYDSAKGDMASAIDSSAELLVKMNKRDLIINSETNYSDQLTSLNNEKSVIESRINSLSTPIYASSSGYFYSEVDGYENIFNISMVEKIDLDSFDAYANASPNEALKSSNSMKIVNSFIWYMVCKIDTYDYAFLEEGRSYTLSFPDNRESQIKMELVRIDKQTNSTEALLVFRVNKLPSDFDYKRFQKAKIIKSDITGLSIPKKALRVVDGVEGVYILVGDVVRFRTVKRIAEKDNYYVVELVKDDGAFEEDSKEEDKNKPKLYPLSLYDNVIVSGKNLFDGKILG